MKLLAKVGMSVMNAINAGLVVSFENRETRIIISRMKLLKTDKVVLVSVFDNTKGGERKCSHFTPDEAFTVIEALANSGTSYNVEIYK